MSEILLHLPEDIRLSIWKHLLESGTDDEEAAFGFADYRERDGSRGFHLLEWFAVPPEGFAYRSPYYLELSDETRARMIKRAHDLGASLVEFHSHRGHWPAKFSESDLRGFTEWVPHVSWRLRGQPYAAVVVATSTFDGIAWIESPKDPERIAALVTGPEGRLAPTHRSSLRIPYDG